MKLFASAFVILSFVVCLAFDTPVFGQSVVPNALQNMAGNFNGDAFDCTRANGLRSQTVFLGSEVGKGTIVSLAARGLPNSGPLAPTTFPDVTIIMSTTPVSIPGLSTTFASNYGGDTKTVFQGPFIQSAPDCTGLNPCPFASPIHFQKPFHFDPADGNLLVEFIIPACNVIDALPNTDATFNDAALISVIQTVSEDDSSGPMGTLFQFAVVTQFNFAGPIPTLSEWGLIAMASILGIVGFMVIRRRKVSA